MASSSGTAAAEKSVVKLTLTAKQIIKSMSELKDEDLLALTKTTAEVTITSIDVTIFSIFEYQGFDPEAIVRKLLVLQKHYELSDDDMKVQIMYMIAANIYMGNLSGKALGRRSQEGRDMIDDLCSRYEIKVGTTNTGLPSDVLTFPRIAGSFPVLSCKMATVLPTKDHPGKPFMSVTVPKFMRMNAFASLCHPDLGERTRVFLLKAVAAYSCDQGIVYEEGRRKKLKMKAEDLKVDAATVAADQWTFIWNAAESKVPPKEVKQAAFVAFNVSGVYSTILPIVNNYNTIMKDTTPVPSDTEFSTDITNFLAPSSQVTA